MQYLLLIAFIIGGLIPENSAEASGCIIPTYYRDLDCIAIKTNADGCPMSFECPVYNETTSVCDYHGVEYKINENVPDEEAPKCRSGCICFEYGGSTHFRCKTEACPEEYDPPPQGCVVQKGPTDCCNQKTVCDSGKIQQLHTCFLEGRQYRLHEEMSPESESCYKCYCEEDFDNSTIINNPNCYEINCALEVHNLPTIRAGCIPIYQGDAKCCPGLTWKCPSNTDRLVLPKRSTDGIPPEDLCIFGKLKIAKGDRISHEENSCVECVCSIPPVPTCIEKRNCQHVWTTNI